MCTVYCIVWYHYIRNLYLVSKGLLTGLVYCIWDASQINKTLWMSEANHLMLPGLIEFLFEHVCILCLCCVCAVCAQL